MVNTLYQEFQVAAARYPDHVALMHKVHGEYAGLTYRELLRDIDAVAANLWQMGLRKGDAIGICSGNRPEWAMADLAALKLGCVVVPIPPNAPAAYVGFMAIDARIKLLFVENERVLRIIRSLPGHLSPVKLIVLYEDTSEPNVDTVLSFHHLRATRSPHHDTPEVVTGDDLATIVYTSGTTGDPKGVMLTHRNIVSNALAVQKRFSVSADDQTLSYLPLSHMFERTCGYYAMLFAGAAIAYAESSATLAADVQSIRPTMLLAVPSVIEKAYRRVVGEINSGSRVRRIIVALAVQILNAHANRLHKSQRIPVVLRALNELSNRYVAFKFRQLGGGRLRIVASGGAPLDRKIAKLYHIIGFNIVEGYGLTETSPIVACHIPSEREFGTVGKPLEGVEVRIGEQNEILVRGPNVMRGYLNRPQETARVIDADGWFHTGDQGMFDAHYNLRITGRLKDVIVLSTGEKIPAATIEARLTRSPYICQAVLFGDRRKHLGALLVPDRTPLMEYARQSGIAAASYDELLRQPKIRELLQRQIEVFTAELLPHERVRTFDLLADPFTLENGFLTLTLKVRKSQIEERYRDRIESLFAASDASKSHVRGVGYAA